MNIACVLTVYALDIRPLVDCLTGPDVSWHVYLHSQRPDVMAACVALAQTLPGFHYHPYGVNRGVAKSWNDGVVEAYAQGADLAVILNDDILATYADLAQVATVALAKTGPAFVEGQMLDKRTQQWFGTSFAMAPITKALLNAVGYLDENFCPAYYEDCDYRRRIALAGVPSVDAGQTGIVHLGKVTINSNPELLAQTNVTFAANGAYFAAKWGGPLGSEQFIIPFGDPRYDLKIREADRHNPYPDHQRTDLDMVKV